MDGNKAAPLLHHFVKCKRLCDLDDAVARALCFWPSFCSLLHLITSEPEEQAKVAAWLEALDIESCCKPASVAQDDSDASTRVRWPIVLALLLAAACELPGEVEDRLTALIRPNEAEGRSAGDYGRGSRFGFYYRFAAAFQAWISTHTFSPPEHWAKAKAAICRDCRANAPPNALSRLIVDLFYEDVGKTRGAFRAIFGICAKDIGLTADGKVLRRAAQIGTVTPRIVATSESTPHLPNADDTVRRLWGELLWMMWEVEDLAFVRRNVADHERTVHEYMASSYSRVSDDAGADDPKSKEAWDSLFRDIIYPHLKPFQFTLFVRTTVTETVVEDADVIRFETHRSPTLQELGIRLPTDEMSPDDPFWLTGEKASAIERLNEIVGRLYEKGFPRSFFSRLKELRLSSADPARTFPFILFPDGEISFYYALDIAGRIRAGISNQLTLRKITTVRDDAKAISAILTETGGPDRDAIWTEGGHPYDLFPGDEANSSHHRCAALVGAARMLMEEVSIDATRPVKQSADAILKEFCGAAPPDEHLRKTLINKTFAAGHGDAKPRIEWEPEVMLRRGDPHCHTLFFLPIGNDSDGVPTAMIAGTLRGVELRWLPFSSKRMVSYLLPLAYILRPLLDRMVHGVFLKQAVKAARAEKDRDFRRKLEEQVHSLFTQIDSVSRSASRLQSEVAPAPIRFFAARSRTLDKLFIDGETTVVDADTINKLGLQPEKLKWLKQEGDQWEYHAVHGSGGADGVPTYDKVNVTKSLIAATASVLQGSWLLDEFLKPLLDEVRDENSADDAFRVLKRFLHRYHARETLEISIADLLIVLRLCAHDVAARYGGGLAIEIEGQPIGFQAPWLEHWREMSQAHFTFANLGLKNRTFGVPTAARFLSALIRLLTDEMKTIAEGAHGRADIRKISLFVRDLPKQQGKVLDIEMYGHEHFDDPKKLETVDEAEDFKSDESLERGLRGTFRILSSAVDQRPHFIMSEEGDYDFFRRSPRSFVFWHTHESNPKFSIDAPIVRMRVRLPMVKTAGGSDGHRRH